MKMVKAVALTFMAVQLANLPIEYSLTYQWSRFYENYVFLYEAYGSLEVISLIAVFGLLSMFVLGGVMLLFARRLSIDLGGVMLLFGRRLSMDTKVLKVVLCTFIVVQLANIFIELWLLSSLPLIF